MCFSRFLDFRHQSIDKQEELEQFKRNEVWELDYIEFRVPMFKCKWVNGNTSVRQDEFGFTLVDLNKVGYMDEPFIMAQQARQVFYV